MKFCRECGSFMVKNTTAQGTIIFQCQCALTEEGRPEDTLMAEGYMEHTESSQKHDVFIDNASHDPAANIVMKSCPDCSLPFLTMIRVTTSEITMYVCDCGYRATHTEYMGRMMNPVKSVKK